MMSNRFGANRVGIVSRWATLVTIAMWSFGCSKAAWPQQRTPILTSPNLTDDQGYSDIGCFGAQGFQTPHLDQLAREGRRFTDFYVAASVCTASRAALMSGCYPNRVSMFGALNHTSREGIHPNEFCCRRSSRPGLRNCLSRQMAPRHSRRVFSHTERI